MSNLVCPQCGNPLSIALPFSPMSQMTCLGCKAVLGFSTASTLRWAIGAALASGPILILSSFLLMDQAANQWIVVAIMMPLAGLGGWLMLGRWGRLVVDPSHSERIDKRLDPPRRVAFWLFTGVTFGCSVGSVLTGLLWPNLRDLVLIPMLIAFPVGLYALWPVLLGKRGVLRNWNAEDSG